ncbi:MAG: hypothetical protein K1Y36_19450, partial [Blastocatellia bacterium]|nr:hypothetical protein [Blastocatellia bacterium]
MPSSYRFGLRVFGLAAVLVTVLCSLGQTSLFSFSNPPFQSVFETFKSNHEANPKPQPGLWQGPSEKRTIQPRATLTVTNGNDSGAGSLRDTVAAAAAGDTIVFSGVSTVTLTSATINITVDLTIDGGTSGVTITRSGATNFRLFLVSANVTLNKLTLTNGNSTPGTSSALNGGAVRSTAGNLTLTGCSFSGNNSSNGGGAVDAATTAGVLTVSDCTFTNNTCANAGGAIIISSPGPNFISNSTFNSNSTTGTAGAINIGTATTMTNCTVTGNSSAGTGGAINVTATSTFTNVTVVGNTSSQAAQTTAGGVRTGTSTFTYTFNNCLIAGNTTPNGTNGSTTVQLSNFTSGTTTSSMTGFNNVIGDNTSIINSPNLANGVNNNLIGTAGSPLSPMVNALASNGGPTQTMSLQAGSPAVNRVSSGLPGAAAPTLDQRGFSRPDAADTGAYELNGTPPGVTVSSINRASSNPVCSSASVSWTVTFSGSVTGVTSSNFSLVDGTSGLTGESITGVSGSGTTWTVTASTGTGAGTLGLNMVNSTGVSQSVTNLPFTGQTYTVNAPPATPTITPTPASVCASSTGNQASGPAGATTYAW